MDVKSAFLNGELQEEVFVTQPPRFIVEGEEGKFLRLTKALYGLRQAPQAWYAKLDTVLVALGFHHSESEHALYMRGGGQWHQRQLIIGVYVDDLVITGVDNTAQLLHWAGGESRRQWSHGEPKGVCFEDIGSRDGGMQSKPHSNRESFKAE
jgi:hypothetical protein